MILVSIIVCLITGFIGRYVAKEKNGTTMAPYFARKSHCENILTRLFSNMNMTSTNNFS